MRQAEARDALREAEEMLGAAEEAIDKGEGFALLVPGLREAHWLCSGLGHALEILEANSRACGEGAQVMSEYPPLIVRAGGCEWRLSRLAEQWRETEGKDFSFGRLMSLVTSPFASAFQNMLPTAGLVSNSRGHRPSFEEDEGDLSVQPRSGGDADAGAGGGGGQRSALLDGPAGAWLWGGGTWGDGEGSKPSSAECGVEEEEEEALSPACKVAATSSRGTAAAATPAVGSETEESALCYEEALDPACNGIAPSSRGRLVAVPPVAGGKHEEQEEQVILPARVSKLEADVLRLKLEMERKAMQAEDSAARSREVQEAMMHQLLVAKGLQEVHSDGQEVFFDPADEQEDFFDPATSEEGQEEFLDPGEE